MEMDMSGGEEDDMEAPIKVVKNYKRQVCKMDAKQNQNIKSLDSGWGDAAGGGGARGGGALLLAQVQALHCNETGGNENMNGGGDMSGEEEGDDMEASIKNYKRQVRKVETI